MVSGRGQITGKDKKKDRARKRGKIQLKIALKNKENMMKASQYTFRFLPGSFVAARDLRSKVKDYLCHEHALEDVFSSACKRDKTLLNAL